MATSTRTVTIDEYDQISVNEKTETGAPRDVQVDSDGKKALIGKIEKVINELKLSQFYHDFRKELQNSPISKCIRRVLGSESKMQMVIYGIGSIKNDCPKLQLSLAILMKKDFTWIEGVEVFDPILSAIEIQVLESFGCSVLSINEHGRRQALKPTMFFMPHCDVSLYNNLLEANWEPDLLRNVIIFGNSFNSYIKDNVVFLRHFSTNDDTKRKLGYIWRLMGHILAAQTFTKEFKMRTIISYDLRKNGQVTSFYRTPFSNLTWHFFSCLTMRRMRLMREKIMEEHGVHLNQNVKLGEGGRLVLPEI